MRRFLVGLLLGLFFGIGISASAALVVGHTGYLSGWDVTNQDGEVICSDPYVYVNLGEIECDSN